jgi:hypothetical protein
MRCMELIQFLEGLKECLFVCLFVCYIRKFSLNHISVTIRIYFLICYPLSYRDGYLNFSAYCMHNVYLNRKNNIMK